VARPESAKGVFHGARPSRTQGVPPWIKRSKRGKFGKKTRIVGELPLIS